MRALDADAGGGRIRILPTDLASKIAAGEVIERPASVVKELIENALDAGARRVVIELEDGGRRLVRVSDDGEGMTEDDAVLAFTRHATSKIRQEADLTRILTLGFRGEALPSIAAVAAVELTTRARGGKTGVRVQAEGGVVVDAREAGAPEGTSVTVRDLFAPVPARRKFLKSTTTELGHIVELVNRQGLAATGVHFRVLHQGREIAVYPAVATLEERASQIFGRERARGGRGFSEDRLGVAVRGFAFSPHLSFASGRYLHTYVNGRAIRDRAVSHAVIEGYSTLIPRGRWPGAVVILDVPPADVDVNVHPAKQEVRFRLAHVVHDAVFRALRRALGGSVAATEGVGTDAVAEALARYAAAADAGKPLAFGAAGFGRPRSVSGQEDVAGRGDTGVERCGGGASDGAAVGPDRQCGAAGFAGLRFVGQVFRGYIVCEGADRLVLVDQHAAHERVAFERLRAQHRQGAVERQALLLPITVDLDPRQTEAVIAAEGHLHGLGFEIEPFGDGTVLLRAVPAFLGPDDPRLLFEDLADALAESGSDLPATEALDAVLGRIACHSVIRVGRSLSVAEVEALLSTLDTLGHASSCPHGRPVWVEFTRGQIERMFGR